MLLGERFFAVWINTRLMSSGKIEKRTKKKCTKTAVNLTS